LIDTAIDLGTSKAINNKKNNIVSRDWKRWYNKRRVKWGEFFWFRARYDF
jgi:hypothetical protein